MSKAMIKGFVVIGLALVGLFAVLRGGESEAGRAAPVTASATSVASSAGDANAAADLEVPPELSLEAERMACDISSCFTDCNATGWCEGSCLNGVCKCRIRKNSSGMCP